MGLLRTLLRALPGLLVLAAPLARATVLPEDRADVLYHRYDGGGVVVQGPSILLRQKLGESVSVSANYYVDMISSASIDVVTTASPYTERREQKSLSVDFLRGKAIYNIGYVDSAESDYSGKTAFASVSQDLFGDLTTVSFGFSRGWDVVGKRAEPDFRQTVDRRNFRVGVTQVLTRNLLSSLNFENVTEQGYLQNPYRNMRYAIGGGYTYGPEIYPHTRTGNAGAVMLKYYLPWRAALQGQYRYYQDTWDIRAHTGRLEFTQPLWKEWVFTGSYRYYRQNAASFYSDLFPSANFQNFMGRDKEIAAYASHTLGASATYEYRIDRFSWLKKGTINLSLDHIMIDYRNFSDLRNAAGLTPGSEPLYSLDANVLQFFFSFWF
jgi:hypothetical protein